MADRNRLLEALKNADAAGDTAAAMQFAAQIRAMDGGQNAPQDELAAAGVPDGGAAVGGYDPALLPVKRVPEGKGMFSIGSHAYDLVVPGVLKDAWRVISEGGHAARGQRTMEEMQAIGPEAALLAVGAPGAGAVAKKAAEVVPEVAAKAAAEAAATAKGLPVKPGQLVAPKTANVMPVTGEMLAPPAGQLTAPLPEAVQAEKKIYEAMIQAGWTPERIAAKLRQLGPDATLADVAPFWGMQDVAAQSATGGQRAARVLGQREAQKQSKLLKAVDSAVGDKNYYEELDKLQDARSVAGKADREAAMANTGIVKSDVIQRMLETPEFQQGLRKGAAIARLEAARTGIPVPKSETWYHGQNFDDPNIKIIETPTLRMLDAAKQGMDQILQPFRNKFTGALENLGPYEVEVDKARRAVVEEMRAHSADYGKYLDTWGDYSSNMDAVAKGRRALSQDPEIVAKTLNKMTPSELEHFQIGLARDMRDEIVANPNTALKWFQNRYTRDILQKALPNKKDYNLFRQSALREAAKSRTFRDATGNSKSVRRALGALEQEAPSKVPEEVVGAAFDVATKNPVGLIRRGARWLTRQPKIDTVTPVLEQESQVLHTTDPDIQRRVLQRLRRQYGASGTSGIIPRE